MKKINAFTLAEILITLAITGILAALTIPSVIQNFQERSWQTSSNVFERKLTEALKIMNSEAVLAGHRTTEEFVNELSKHIKITKICNSDEIASCFEEKIVWEIVNLEDKSETETVDMTALKTAADLGMNDWGTETAGVQFANGVTGVIAYNPDCRQDPYSNQITGTNCISLVYDTSGYKSPDTFTKDVRGINSFLNKCLIKDGSTCFSAPFYPEGLTETECNQIKDSLGIYKCYNITDYWAGAVKTCGGINKMANLNQISRFANYIYNSEGITGSAGNLTRYDDRLSKLGFVTKGNGTLYFMSNAESGMENLLTGVVFDSDRTLQCYFNRSAQNTAVCVVD